MTAEVTEEHIALAHKLTGSRVRRFPWMDYDDAFSAALYALAHAARTWEQRAPFEHYAAKGIRFALNTYLRDEAARFRNIRQVPVYEADVDSGASLFDEVCARIRLEDTVRLLKESDDYTRAAVLRPTSESDAELARRFGYTSRRPTANRRKAFFAELDRRDITGYDLTPRGIRRGGSDRNTRAA